MFHSIKEKLILIKNQEKNKIHSLIAEYLLECIENNKTPKLKDCTVKAFCAESAITAFAQKYGYHGFKELSIRIKIETEYYDFTNIHKTKSLSTTSNYRSVINSSLNLIDNQETKINNFIADIKIAKNIYAISCYQQLINTELFISELQLLGYNAWINLQRKSNAAFVKKINKDDICIIVAFGLDNQYVVNYYNLIKEITNNIYLICSPSQKHKFLKLKEAFVIDCYKRSSILDSTRSMLLLYLFSNIIFQL